MRKPHVLLVEDHDWTRELYALQLKKSGYIVTSTDTAQGALDAFDEHKIDLVVLDIVLPHNNGLTFLHERQSYEDIRRVPVVIISSLHRSDMKVTEQLWQELGVTRYCYKPKTKPADLQEVIAEVIKNES